MDTGIIIGQRGREYLIDKSGDTITITTGQNFIGIQICDLSAVIKMLQIIYNNGAEQAN